MKEEGWEATLLGQGRGVERKIGNNKKEVGDYQLDEVKEGVEMKTGREHGRRRRKFEQNVR